MIIIPAIDLIDGKVVRLTQGEYDREKVYDADPLERARHFHECGATRIHVVDLVGARDGKPTQLSVVKHLVESVPADFEVGGGIRDAGTVDRYLAAGLWRVVVGTRACLDKGFLREVLSAFGERVIVGVDARDGCVATDGWTRVTETRALELVDRVAELGGREVIYTDIATDGMMAGPNFDQVREVLEKTPIQIIASGGVSSMEDIRKFLEFKNANLTGVIVGKAIYEGKVDVKEAVALCGGGD